MTEAKINKLQLQRQVHIEQISRAKKFVTECGATASYPELELRLINLDKTFENICTAQAALEALDPLEFEKKTRAEFEESYFIIKPALQVHMCRLQKEERIDVKNIDHKYSMSVRLPKIEIKPFSGDYTKWLEFHEAFDTLVHGNEMLNDVSKFQYLRNSLTSSASRVIDSLELTGQNYHEAINLLSRRFNNKKLICSEHIRSIFLLKSIAKPSAEQLRELIDCINAHLRSLTSLGRPTQQWDDLIVHIIYTKIDSETRAKWDDESPADRLCTLEELFNFLNRRCQNLEGSSSTLKGITHEQSKNMVQPMRRPATQTQSSFVTSSKFKCLYCLKPNHMIYRCRKFLNCSTYDRNRETARLNICSNCLKSDHAVHSCPSKASCFKCNAKHHTLLHVDSARHVHPNSEITNKSSDVRNIQAVNESVPDQVSLHIIPETTNSSSLTSNHASGYVYLATAVIKVLNVNGTAIMGRALLDSASQLNFITQSFGAQLGLKFRKGQTPVCGIGGSTVACHSQTIVTIQSCFNSFSTELEVHVLPNITGKQPSMRMNTSSWKIPSNIHLADPQFDAPQRVDMLIGAQLFFNLLSVGQIKMSDDLPILQNTLLGWVISGRSTLNTQYTNHCNVATADDAEEQVTNNLLQRFWEIETSEPTPAMLTPEEEICEQHFNDTVARSLEGNFIVSLPLLRSPSSLGNSRTMAEKRFFSLETRLNKNIDLRQQYSHFLDEYKTLGHMKAIDDKDIADHHYYMPHHCVFKPESTSTKLRVVFDASSKTSSGISLNNILMVGPVVQQDLLSILLRFRTHFIVFSADIVKMYRQIRVSETDAHLQYILWRNTPDEKLTTFQLQTVTYGTASAPYLATKCLQRLAQEEASNYPQASEVILRDVYVDDILTGSNSLKEAMRIKSQTIDMLSTAGMELKKWCSNHPALLLDIPTENREKLLSLDDGDVIKTLGLFWQPHFDQFRFNVKLIKTDNRITKRTVLSDIARIFDPLGVTGPVIIVAKIFMQQLWLLKQNWDAALPQNLHTKWHNFRTNLQLLNNLRIDRYIFSDESPKSIQLHGYADASEKAYGCAIYVRSVNLNNDTTVKLLCAKSKVAPLKTTTLPRLELCAALLLAQTMNRIVPILNLNIEKKFYWSDSKIVLSWIEGHSSCWKTFVANRVATIQDISSKDEWNHVDSKNNVADVISRGIMPEEFGNVSIWFNGPEYLLLPEDSWNVNKTWYELDCPERKPEKCVLTTLQRNDNQCILQRIKFRNNFISLRNVMAYILRYLHNSQRRNKVNRKTEHLSQEELNLGLHSIINLVQEAEFPSELELLRSKKPLHKKNHLNSLSIFLDDKNLIRVGGRLQLSAIPYSSKHPILLPSKHFFTLTLLNYLHTKNLHAGPQALLAVVRQEYWPIQGRRLVQRVFRSCIRCFKTRPTGVHQIMGNLPPERIRCSPPFTNVGVDYCGPVYVHHKIRGKAPTKAYICVFICFAVKAVHLELVTELTTAAFIGALKRFVAMRGLCANIFSDNGTNFVGANSELTELFKLFSSQKHNDDIIRMCQADGITWHFAPPASPHFGGLYEAAVKSVKFHLRRVVANASLTFEELNTVLKQIEAVLNSRPLTPNSSTPDDFSAITPGHFLIGRSLNAIVEPNIEDETISTLKRWRLVQQIHQHFWSRWSNEYLSELQHRRKWTSKERNVAVGELIVLKDENLPPLKWRLGRIVALHHGQDGNVRVVTINTSQGQIKRAIAKICPLPIDDGDNE